MEIGNRTILEQAIRNGNRSIVELLLNAGARVPFDHEMANGSRSLLEELIFSSDLSVPRFQDTAIMMMKQDAYPTCETLITICDMPAHVLVKWMAMFMTYAHINLYQPILSSLFIIHYQ
jgi:hypothetical protein